MNRRKQRDFSPFPVRDSVDGMASELLWGLKDVWKAYRNNGQRENKTRAIIQRLHAAYKMKTNGKPPWMPRELIPSVMDTMRRVAEHALDAYKKVEQGGKSKRQGTARGRKLTEAREAAIQVLIEEFIKPQLRDQSAIKLREEAYRRFRSVRWNSRVDGIATQLASCIYGLAPGSIAKSKFRAKRRRGKRTQQ